MTVLVLDGSERSALATVRSLGRRGIPVHVGECFPRSLATYSRYCTGSVVYADPYENRRAFVEDLRRIVAERDYEMVFAAQEETTIPLSMHKETFERATTVPYPDWNRMELTVDKRRTFEIAEEIGVPTPKTYCPERPEALADLEGELEFPLVVKPNSKTTWVDERPIVLKVTEENYVDDFDEMVDVATDIYDALGEMPLVQEYIPGVGFGVEVLCDDGTTEAMFMHRRLREYPITGGASTYRESVYEPVMKGPAVDLMEALRWTGVAMVEFRLDDRDGEPKLMEVNGRFWGSLPLAVAAGVDFPYLLYQLYRGESIPVTDYETGVRSRWLLPGDLLWLLSSLKDDGNRIGTLREFSSFRGTNYDILSADDPYPIVGSVRDMVRQGFDVLGGNRNLSGERTH